MPSERAGGDDLYDVLGVARDADAKSLKRAYRKLAMKWHPDKHPENAKAAADKFKDIAEAYAILGDPEKRRMYDRFGYEGLKGMHGESGASTGEFSMRVDPNELFAQFFNGFGRSVGIPFDAPFVSFRSTSPSPPRRSRSRSPHGNRRRVVVDLWCTLEELYSGVLKRMRVSRKRYGETEGSGSPRILEIDVKPGWKAGTRITFANEGDEIAPGVFQDIVFVVKIREHSTFRRNGADLIHVAHVALVDALTGFILTVPTLDGEVLKVDIDGVVDPKTTKVVVGKGMPRGTRYPGEYGDLIITFDVSFPRTPLTDAQKKALREGDAIPRM